MKMNKLITTSLLALAGVALLQSSALAQSFAPGSLLIDFRLNSGSGTTGSDLEVNLGLASSFNFTTSQTLSQLSVNDLNTLYGSGNTWNSNASLVWSVVAADASNNLFLSVPSEATETAGVPVISNTSGDAGTISGLYQESGGTQAANASSFTVAPADANSYANVIRNVDSGAGQYPADYNFVAFEATTEKGVSSIGTSLDIYKFTPATGKGGAVPGTVTDLGDFTLSGAGVLTYTPDSAEVVPEPSTYALLGLGALALVLMRRRSIQA